MPAIPTYGLGKTVSGPIWTVKKDRLAEFVTHETRMGLGIIVTHDCALDKEFNEYVARLVEAGRTRDEAKAEAETRDDLDQTLLVSPLYFLSEIPEAYQTNIAQKIGYFPLAEIPGLPDLNLVANLREITTVDHRLIPQTVVSLSPVSVSRLRYKLAELFAYRSLSSLTSLSKITGQEVIDVQVYEQSKKNSRIVIRVEDGSEYILDAKPPSVALEDEVTRASGLRPPAAPSFLPDLNIPVRERLRQIYRLLFRW